MESDSPDESVTVRCTRYHTLVEDSPEVGIGNVPSLIPGSEGMNGWVWSSWWNTIDHSNALSGRSPSSVSLPLPSKATTVPPSYRSVAAGAMMAATGRSLVSTVRVAVLLSVEPSLFVARSWKVSPVSEASTALMVSVGAVSPGMGAPLRSHCRSGTGLPTAAASKLTSSPAATVASAGWSVMIGAESSPPTKEIRRIWLGDRDR